MLGVFHDLRQAGRNLRRDPAFTLSAIVVFAVGIGMTTATFNIAGTILFRPLPYPSGERLVTVFDHHRGRTRSYWVFVTPYSQLETLREEITGLDQLGGYQIASRTLHWEDRPERVQALAVEPNLFGMLGAHPRFGTLFSETENAQGRHLAVLSSSLWKTRFGGDPAVLESVFELDDVRYTVIGVMGDDFQFPGWDAEIYVPLSPSTSTYCQMLGRVASDRTLETVREELIRYYEGRDGSIERTPPSGASPPLESIYDRVVRNVRQPMWAVLGAVTFLLLIASANGANLLLARSQRRHSELATRAVLGARRGRIFGLLALESLLLALLGGVGGILLSYWLVKFVVQISPERIPRLNEVVFDLPFFIFAFGISLLCGAAAGLAPMAGMGKLGLMTRLRGGAEGDSRSGRWARNGLITVEIALTLVLLGGCGLMVRSLMAMAQVDLGFDPLRLVAFELNLPREQYAKPEQRRHLTSRLQEEISSVPGVESVAVASILPLEPNRSAFWIRFPEGTEPPGFTGANDVPGFASNPGSYVVNAVTTGNEYFELLAIPLLNGRFFQSSDTDSSPPVALISRSMAEDLWPQGGAIGKRLPRGEEILEIVGVVEDIRFGDPRFEYLPTVYTNIRQEAAGFSPRIIVKAAIDPKAVIPALRRRVWAVDARLPLSRVMTVEESLSRWFAEPKYYTLLLTVFAAAALILALTGLYAVLAYLVDSRRREIAIRMALGADRGRTLRDHLVHGLTLALTGLGAGLIGVWGLNRALESLLFKVSPLDPPTLVAVSLILLSTSVSAVLIPARRACRLDPMKVLRHE